MASSVPATTSNAAMIILPAIFSPPFRYFESSVT